MTSQSHIAPIRLLFSMALSILYPWRYFSISLGRKIKRILYKGRRRGNSPLKKNRSCDVYYSENKKRDKSNRTCTEILEKNVFPSDTLDCLFTALESKNIPLAIANIKIPAARLFLRSFQVCVCVSVCVGMFHYNARHIFNYLSSSFSCRVSFLPSIENADKDTKAAEAVKQ